MPHVASSLLSHHISVIDVGNMPPSSKGNVLINRHLTVVTFLAKQCVERVCRHRLLFHCLSDERLNDSNGRLHMLNRLKRTQTWPISPYTPKRLMSPTTQVSARCVAALRELWGSTMPGVYALLVLQDGLEQSPPNFIHYCGRSISSSSCSSNNISSMMQ